MGKERSVEISLELTGTATLAETIEYFREVSWFKVACDGADGTHAMRVRQVQGKVVQPPRAPRPNERRPGRKKNAKREGRRRKASR